MKEYAPLTKLLILVGLVVVGCAILGSAVYGATRLAVMIWGPGI